MTDAATTTETVFDVRDITLRFGGVVSLRNVSMHMNRGEILAVIGPNGAVRRRCSTHSPVSTNPRRGRSTSPIATGEPSRSSERRRIVSRGPACREPFRRHASSARSPYLRTSRSGRGPRRHRRVGAILRGPATRRGEHASDQLTLELLDSLVCEKTPTDRVRPLLRRTSTPGDRAGHRHRSRRHLVGRTGGRHEPVGETRAGRADSPCPQ